MENIQKSNYKKNYSCAPSALAFLTAWIVWDRLYKEKKSSSNEKTLYGVMQDFCIAA